MKNKIKTWLSIGIIVIVVIGLLSGCSFLNKNDAKADKDSKVLSILAVNHPWLDSIKPLIPEFEAKTGIKIEIKRQPDDYITAKLTVPLTGEWSTPDVFMFRPLQEGRLLMKNGWIQALDDYVNNEKNYDINDFFKNAIGASTIDGKLTGIPIVTEQEILYYRKDLLKNAGLSIPKTIDELVLDSKKLHNPSQGMYGFVGRGERSALIPPLSSFIYSEGGDFIKEGKASINTQEAISAFETYSSLLKNYSSSEAIRWSWPQAMEVFAQGNAAFYTDASSLYKSAINPDTSKIIDKIGYAVFPAGKAGAKHYNITPWVLGINPYSKNKDYAWQFISWATSKEVVLRTQKNGNQGARMSAWNSSEGTSGFPEELVRVIKESSQEGVDHDKPLVISVGDARDVVGSVVEAALNGQDIKTAADVANSKLQDIINKDNSN